MSYAKKIQAGKQVERDTAYYLSVIAERIPGIYVFNDISFKNGDFNVQIDHLVLYDYGFIVIESKSVFGEVRVNELGEWSRSYKGEWYGFKSPFKQVEVQKYHLNEYLYLHRAKILKKVLMLQPSFGGREWSALACISSTSIIHREQAPKEIKDFIVKNEFLYDAVLRIVKRNRILSNTPKFTSKSMERIAAFLRQHEGASSSEVGHVEAASEEAKVEPTVESANESQEEEPKQASPAPLQAPADDSSKGKHKEVKMSCKKCSSVDLEPRYGKFGYYFNCNQCSANTSMPKECPQCSCKSARTQKKGNNYFVACQSCGVTSTLIY